MKEDSSKGEVCDAYVPAHLQDSGLLEKVVGLPMGDSEDINESDQ